jgi:hypothetical protein
LSVYVDNSSGAFTADEIARIQDAIAGVNSLLAPYSVTITEVTDPAVANVVLRSSTTSASGSVANGVLGCYDESSSTITMIQGWNWYDGSDPAQIGADQYDFQTVITHELGHALGLGGSADASSPMDEVLPTGTARRTMTTPDLHIPFDDGNGPDAEWAGGSPVRRGPAPTVQTAPVPVVINPRLIAGPMLDAAIAGWFERPRALHHEHRVRQASHHARRAPAQGVDLRDGSGTFAAAHRAGHVSAGVDWFRIRTGRGETK